MEEPEEEVAPEEKPRFSIRENLVITSILSCVCTFLGFFGIACNNWKESVWDYLTLEWVVVVFCLSFFFIECFFLFSWLKEKLGATGGKVAFVGFILALIALLFITGVVRHEGCNSPVTP